MDHAHILLDELNVEKRLTALFGVKRSEFLPVVRAVVGAKADAVEDDPVGAAGLFAYIHGTRNMRALFRAKGWSNYRRDGVELVRHPDRQLMIAYQNVDLACDERHVPRAISGKGAGSSRVMGERCTQAYSR